MSNPIPVFSDVYRAFALFHASIYSCPKCSNKCQTTLEQLAEETQALNEEEFTSCKVVEYESLRFYNSILKICKLSDDQYAIVNIPDWKQIALFVLHLISPLTFDPTIIRDILDECRIDVISIMTVEEQIELQLTSRNQYKTYDINKCIELAKLTNSKIFVDTFSIACNTMLNCNESRKDISYIIDKHWTDYMKRGFFAINSKWA